MPLVRNSQNPNGVNVTDEAFANSSNFVALKYLETEPDVRQQAVAKTLARGITPDNPEYATVLANYGKEHYARYGRFEPARQSIFVDAFKENQGYYDVGQASAVGAAPQLVYQGSTAESFINTVPRIDGSADNQPPGVIPTPNGLGFQFPDTGGDDAGGGDDVISGPPPGDTSGPPPNGGMMSGPVDLAPVTNLIGTPGTTQTGPQATLMGQTAGLATGQQGIRDIVTPLGEQVTGIRDIVTPLGEQVTGIGTQIGTADTDAGQTDLFAGQRGIMSGIGTAGTDTTPGTGLVGGQANIQAGIGTAGEGQTDLFAGQAGLATGQQAMQATQAGLEAGQLGLGQQIGTAAVTNEQGEVTQQPTGLYAGQAGLMSGQTGLTQDVSGLSRDLSGIGDQLSGDLSGLGGQLGAFRTAAEQYQRGATTQRGDIQGTQRAGQAALTAQVQGVGQQANRAAEMMAQQRQQQQQPAVQQQAAQFAQSAPRATPSNQQVGPMGPMAADPRDALIQQLLTRNASLMNNRPV